MLKIENILMWGCCRCLLPFCINSGILWSFLENKWPRKILAFFSNRNCTLTASTARSSQSCKFTFLTEGQTTITTKGCSSHPRTNKSRSPFLPSLPTTVSTTPKQPGFPSSVTPTRRRSTETPGQTILKDACKCFTHHRVVSLGLLGSKPN